MPIRHSVRRSCFAATSVDELCRRVAAMGGSSVEMLDEADWGVPAKHGLVCAVAEGPGPVHLGWNRGEYHRTLLERSDALLPKLAAAKIPAMVVYAGERKGLEDRAGMKSCVLGLEELLPRAERHGVTVLLALLNSKVDHPDYHFDRMAFGLEVLENVASPRLKILYGIYHAQIMEGDVIRTIRDHIDAIGHFHTGGVPGRHEIDDTQELNYAAVCAAIAASGYEGFVGQDFVPTKDPMTALREAFEICGGKR